MGLVAGLRVGLPFLLCAFILLGTAMILVPIKDREG